MLSDSNISRILEAAMSKTADFAEVFYEENSARGIALLNGKVTGAGTNYDAGVGIRLMAGTNVVYVYSSDKDPDTLIKLALEAADALKGGSPAEIKALEALCKSTPNRIMIDPMKTPKSDMVDFIKKASDYATSYNEMITQTTGSISTGNRLIRVCNSRGLNKEESQSRIRLSFEVIATKGNEKQTGRIAPGSMRGYEFINEYPIIEKTQECCDTAIRMAGAGYAPSGKMPVILGNGFGGVIFHEACGHALESTSVGIKSSCFTDNLNTQIASPVVSAWDNARIEGEWGSYMIDDEGNESSNLQLIKDGILTNYLIDELGSRRMNMPATGCSRRSNYSYAPTSRMSNTFIANGSESPESIIADTEYGLYCTKLGGGSVDTATGEFNFASNEAFMIRNGKICEPVRGATLIGKGQEVLMDIDRVGNDLELSAGVCGSISGSVPVTVGQPTIRVSSMLVGGREAGEE
ncbi:MAG: TldD/PmbA family protein [Saccharofermentans sp.]|nr:TldD/PmbA family protein [Saccharofermentans sp.]